MEVSDQEAVRATLKDRHAFSILVGKYQAPLFRYIQRLGASDPDSAKDILQETFIKAYLNLNDYNAALPFSSWIYRIAHNETMTHFRRQKSRPQPAHGEFEQMLFETVPDDLDIAAESDAKLRSAHIAQALRMLKPEFRDVLVLRFFEGKSYDEISDILRMPPGTVATYVSRGKRALGELLRRKDITDVYYGNDG